MEIAIFITALAAGLAAGYFIGKLTAEKAAGEEKAVLLTRAKVLETEAEGLRESHAKQIKDMDENHARQVKGMRESYEREIGELREASETLRRESDKMWQQKLEAVKQEMQKTTVEQLAAKQSALQQSNREQMDELFKPLKEQFAEFRKSVEETRTQNEVNKNDLQKTFEATMKLFRQEQQQTVSSLKEQTQRIGEDAENLTRALKGDSKVQGDWGEMVLGTILENSGLRRGEEYFIQETTQDESGRTFRPDVVVRFPEGRSVVIDSKVSLTAYAEAVATEDDAERDRLLRAHAQSVRRHVDELADKDYTGIVSDAIGFALMFIPNETGYFAAMQQMPDLSRYAYQKKIILVSPNTLMMALQLAYNLWQYDRRDKNVENIVKTATALYEKMVNYSETFDGIGAAIDALQDKFGKAQKQLATGPGNVLRRIEQLKDYGITPKKELTVRQ